MDDLWGLGKLGLWDKTLMGKGYVWSQSLYGLFWIYI